MVGERFGRGVEHVFFTQRFKEPERIRQLRFALGAQEAADLIDIAARRTKMRKPTLRAGMGGDVVLVIGADARLAQSGCVCGGSLGRSLLFFVRGGPGGGRALRRAEDPVGMSRREGGKLACERLAERGIDVALKICAAVLDGDVQAALAAAQVRAARAVCDQNGDVAVCRHVQDLNMYPRAADGRARLRDAQTQRDRVGVARGLAEQIGVASFFDQLLVCKAVCGVAAEAAPVDQHRPPRGRHEPAAVKLIFRLTGAHVMPAVTGVDLDPCVVVIAVAPPRGIYLPRGNADTAQRADGKDRFLAAAADASKIRGERALGAAVGGMVGHLLAAPEICLERGLCDAETAEALLELLGKKVPVTLRAFVVHARAENVLGENILRNVRLVAVFRACGDGGGTDLLQPCKRHEADVIQRKRTVKVFQRGAHLAAVRGDLLRGGRVDAAEPRGVHAGGILREVF